MTVDNIVEEFWDEELQGLRWIRESGDDTILFQAEGCDVVIEQQRKGKRYRAWCYSEPGLFLFAAMLKYRNQIGLELPSIDEIQSLFGQRWVARELGYPVDRTGMNFIFKYDFPVAEGEQIIFTEDQMLNPVGGYMGGIDYFAFIENGSFVISVPKTGKEIKSFSMRDGKLQERGILHRSIVLYPECSLRVLKAVNLFYPDNEFLASAHKQATELSEDWIFEEIRRQYD